MDDRPTRAEKLRAWRAANPDKVRAQQKRSYERRRTDPNRWKDLLEWNRKNRKKKYAQMYEYDKSRDRVKVKCRMTVREAIQRGKISRGDCVKCGKPQAQAHHEDYTKPFEIVWLCSTCHAEHHWRNAV